MHVQSQGTELSSERVVDSVIKNPEFRQVLIDHIAEVTQSIYVDKKQAFIDSLSPFNREVYQEALSVPYAKKDWYRDTHDIVVTWAISCIVNEENNRGAYLPEWLITAALLHDRGYGIIASQQDEVGAKYAKLKGTYWDNPDVRIMHSRLSREFAELVLFDESARVKGFEPAADKDLFLEVVEKHDHPLIERFQELPIIGRHHFDADSLYSISLSSFVKDYLATLNDAKKLERWSQGGLFEPGEFRPKDLLEVRLARYYPSADRLPSGWDKESYPLVPASAKFGEGAQCMVPSSETAQSLTDESFHLLARCCTEMEASRSVDQFKAWFTKNLVAQVAALEQRVKH